MIYCETSLIVAALTGGPDASRAQEWLAAQEVGTLCISDLVYIEFSSALNQMVRAGLMDKVTRGGLVSLFHTMARDTFHRTEVSQAAIFQAHTHMNRRDTELGANDALHLAIAWQGRHTFATADPLLAKEAAGTMEVILI